MNIVCMQHRREVEIFRLSVYFSLLNLKERWERKKLKASLLRWHFLMALLYMVINTLFLYSSIY